MAQVIMSMEEFKDYEKKALKLQSIKHLARDILINHTKDDWSKAADLKEALTEEESMLLLKNILEEKED